MCILLPWLGFLIGTWPLLFGLRFTLMTSDKRVGIEPGGCTCIIMGSLGDV